MDRSSRSSCGLPSPGLVVLLLIPSANERAIKIWANIASFLGFLVCLPLVFQFDRTKDFQFVEKADWIPSIGASYHLGIDGYSLLLVVLTGLLGFLSILSSWKVIEERLKEYYAYFLILQVACSASSCRSTSCSLFSGNSSWCRCTSSSPYGAGAPRLLDIKFVIYTLFGSILMLLGILTLYYTTTSSSSAHVRFCRADEDGPATGVNGGCSGHCSLDSPSRCLFPFLSAARRAHGGPHCGLGRPGQRLAEDEHVRVHPLLLAPGRSGDPAIIAVAAFRLSPSYRALMCLMQKDWKKLVAYSSVSHIGFYFGDLLAQSAGTVSSIASRSTTGFGRHALSDCRGLNGGTRG
jgi:NADH-quinone oxidoreductase subunit M